MLPCQIEVFSHANSKKIVQNNSWHNKLDLLKGRRKVQITIQITHHRFDSAWNFVPTCWTMTIIIFTMHPSLNFDLYKNKAIEYCRYMICNQLCIQHFFSLSIPDTAFCIRRVIIEYANNGIINHYQLVPNKCLRVSVGKE